MSVFAFRLEAIAWLIASVYLFIHGSTTAAMIAAGVVFFFALIKAFFWGGSRRLS